MESLACPSQVGTKKFCRDLVMPSTVATCRKTGAAKATSMHLISKSQCAANVMEGLPEIHPLRHAPPGLAVVCEVA